MASSAIDLLRPMLQSRIDAALRAHAGELGTPELIKAMFVLTPEAQSGK